MKQRSTTPVSKGLVTKLTCVTLAIVMIVGSVWAQQPTVKADKYDDQIRALQKEIDEYQAKAGQLQTQIATLQEEIRGIDNQKKLIQAQISLTEAKLAKLQEEISTTEKNIQSNKVALGKTLADLYIDDTVSPLEMLASSR